MSNKISVPITHREMLAVIADWSRCLRESHQPAPRHLWPPHIHRELAVLRALAALVKHSLEGRAPASPSPAALEGRAPASPSPNDQ
jgi:hypothetical protein